MKMVDIVSPWVPSYHSKPNEKKRRELNVIKIVYFFYLVAICSRALVVSLVDKRVYLQCQSENISFVTGTTKTDVLPS